MPPGHSCRPIAGVNRVDGSKMDEAREEMGVQLSLMGGLVKKQLK